VTIDGALNPDGLELPRDWQPCLCPNCAEISMFDHTAPGGLREPTDADWTAWKRDPRLRRALTAVLTAQLQIKDQDS
jgi:hypothetical protein